MISPLSYSTSPFIEGALKGDQNSALALARSLCLTPDSKNISENLRIRLLNPESSDDPVYAQFCTALLDAQGQEGYRLAKGFFKAYLQEGKPAKAVAQAMLIYIKVFSPDKNPQLCKEFVQAIDQIKQKGDFLSEIQIKEEFLEYLLNESSNPEEVERGLKLQLSLIDDLDQIELSGAFYCQAEDLIDKQLERYLCLLIKYFGGSQSDLELEVKKTLIAAKDNPLLNSHQRHLAEYHLANVLLREEFTRICDVHESKYLFENLLKKLDKESPYYCQIKFALAHSFIKTLFAKVALDSDVRLPLACIVNQTHASDLKAKIYSILGLSYLPKHPDNAKDFDIEKAWHYFKLALESAHSSSFLIPLMRYQLGLACLFKKSSREEFEDVKIQFEELMQAGNLTPSFINKINFVYEFLSRMGLPKEEIKIGQKEDCKLQQKLYHGFSALVGDNLYEISSFLHEYRSGLKVGGENSYNFVSMRNEIKTKMIDLWEQAGEISCSDLNTEIFSYCSQKAEEFATYLFKEGEKLKIEAEKIKHQQFHNSIKTDYKINCKSFVQDFYKLFASLESDKQAASCFYFIVFIVKELQEMFQSFEIKSEAFPMASIGVQLSLLNDLAQLIERGNGPSARISMTNKRSLKILRTVILECAQTFQKALQIMDRSQDELIFNINSCKILKNHARFLLSQSALDCSYPSLSHAYYQFLSFFRDHTKEKSDLYLEAGRLHHYYFSHLKSFGSKEEISKNYLQFDKRFDIELAHVKLYLNAFTYAQNNLKKYTVIGSEILNFGPKLITEYVAEFHSQVYKIQFPKVLFILFFTCVDLLRFHDRENEANELIKCLCTLPDLEFFLSDQGSSPEEKKPSKKGSKKGLKGLEASFKKNHTKSIKIGKMTFKGFYCEEEINTSLVFNFEKFPGLKKQLEKAEGVEWIPPLDLTFHEIKPHQKKKKNHLEIKPNLPEIKRTPRIESSRTENQEVKPLTPETSPISPIEFIETNTISLTAETKRRAREALAAEERKRWIKENRVPRGFAPIGLSLVCVESKEPCKINIYLSPSCLKIYNELWIPNSGALNKSYSPPFDPNDYRNDIAITRNDVKKLVEGLGGEYHEEQGKGSHEKVLIPSLYNSPRITFGDSSLTFADFDGEDTPSSQTVTLTKSSDLKFYQIYQLRDKLIKLRLTPDVVKEEMCVFNKG